MYSGCPSLQPKSRLSLSSYSIALFPLFFFFFQHKSLPVRPRWETNAEAQHATGNVLLIPLGSVQEKNGLKISRFLQTRCSLYYIFLQLSRQVSLQKALISLSSKPTAKPTSKVTQIFFYATIMAHSSRCPESFNKSWQSHFWAFLVHSTTVQARPIIHDLSPPRQSRTSG